jgi:DNA-binding response OmpR family regulator
VGLNGSEDNVNIRGLHVLVVEDNADTAASIAMLLRAEGHEVQVASEGMTALRIALDAPPDVALLDIGLPGMDGYQVAKLLHEQKADKRPLLIATTGHGSEEDRRRSAEAGIDLHLGKPVNPDDLRAVLRKFRRVIAE